MNGAQLHLALNHFPVILSITGFAIVLWGWLGKSSEIRKVGLFLLVVTAVFAGAAFLTGEPAEEILEKFPSFPKEFVHDHEEAGEAALIVSILSGITALAALFLPKKKPDFLPYALAASLILSLMSCVAFMRTAHLGGLIHHEEIRP